MEALVEQVRQFASSADQATRNNLVTVLRDVAFGLEDDDDVVHRVGYLPLQTSSVRTGIDMKLFEQLAGHQGPLSTEDLAAKTGADPVLLARLLRALGSWAYIKEAGNGSYEANHTTRLLAVDKNQAGICHIFDTCGPQYVEMPRFLKKTQYKNVTDHYHTVFQDAFKTELGAFEWFEHHPVELHNFNKFMAARRERAETWLSVYPVEDETRGWSSKLPVFVNIGGSIGHQCAEFKVKYPHLPGRVILQDLPHTISSALQTEGVENMAHNFFEPQPVQEAKFYFFRGVLHNHPDQRVRQILQNTKEAMSGDSVILIDEMVLPERGVHPHVAAIDLTMMCAAGSRERTGAQWQALVESAGLKVEKTLTYKPKFYEAVMTVVSN